MLLRGLGREEAQELSKLAAVLSVLVDAELQILAKRLVEFGEVVLILGDLAQKIHALLDDVLANDLENLVLLEGLSGDVEGEILRIDDTLDEVEVLGNDILAIVHDKDTAHVELNVIALLLAFKEIEGCTRITISAAVTMESRGTHRLGM